MNIARVFRLVRAIHGLKAHELATALKLHPSSITLYEQEKRMPRLDVMMRLSSYTKIGVHHLMEVAELSDEEIIERVFDAGHAGEE